MEKLLEKKLMAVEYKRVIKILSFITLSLLLFSNSVSSLNLDFESDVAFTCPISDWNSASGSCITNSSECQYAWTQYYLSNESFISNGNAFTTCTNHMSDNIIVYSDYFTVPNDLAYIQAEFYGIYGIDYRDAWLGLNYQNGTSINTTGRFDTESSYGQNTWETNNMSISSNVLGETVRLVIHRDSGDFSGFRFAVDNITFHMSNDSIINMSAVNDTFPTNQFYGYVNELDGITPIADANLYFCRVSGATNFCPTCDSSDVTRCLSEDYIITDEIGFYNKTLVNGIYEVWIGKADYGTTYAEENIVAGQTINYSIANYTFNYSMLDMGNGESLGGVNIYCEDDTYHTSNDDSDISDSNGNAYLNFYLPPDTTTCSMTKAGYDGGSFTTLSYHYTCIEELDSDILTCDYLSIPMLPSNMSNYTSEAKIVVKDEYTGISIPDVVVSFYLSDSSGTKTGTLIGTEITDAFGGVALVYTEYSYYYIKATAYDYDVYTMDGVFQFPAKQSFNLKTIYLKNSTIEFPDLLITTLDKDSVIEPYGNFEISCTSIYGVFDGSYTTNLTAQTHIVDYIPPKSTCMITSLDDGIDLASCPELGGQCTFYINSNKEINVTIQDYVNSWVYVFKTGAGSLLGDGASLTFYNCSNNTYLDCDYYTSLIDNKPLIRPILHIPNATYIKTVCNLGGYMESNVTQYITFDVSSIQIYMEDDITSCSLTIELEGIILYPIPITFDLNLQKYDNGSYPTMLSESITCDSTQLNINANTCQRKNIKVDCDTNYFIEVNDIGTYYESDSVYISVDSTTRSEYKTFRLEAEKSQDSQSSTGNQTIIGQANQMESYMVTNFLWIIFQLALIVITLFLLSIIAKIVSGSGL